MINLSQLVAFLRVAFLPPHTAFGWDAPKGHKPPHRVTKQTLRGKNPTIRGVQSPNRQPGRLGRTYCLKVRP